ncbi:MAG: histidine phosphatase family protein, partial [Thiotrichaceae bacterium]
MNRTTQFMLLRHGLPELAERLLGRTDPRLTEQGWQQMHASTAALDVDVIISSPLLRCYDFAKQMAQVKGINLVTNDAWQELDFGDWDGRLVAELWADEQHAYRQFWHEPFNHSPPQGESSASLLARVSHSITLLSQQYRGRRLLIVTHSGVMRMVLAWLLDSKQQGNSHLSCIQLEHAALLHFTTYLDEDALLWPQL